MSGEKADFAFGNVTQSSVDQGEDDERLAGVGCYEGGHGRVKGCEGGDGLGSHGLAGEDGLGVHGEGFSVRCSRFSVGGDLQAMMSVGTTDGARLGSGIRDATQRVPTQGGLWVDAFEDGFR